MIRRANKNDIEQLAVLFDEYRVFYRMNSDIEGAKEFLLARMSNNESVIFIAEEKGSELMGFVQLYPKFTSTRLKRLWLLNDLYVNPSFRGKGVSVDLIEAAKKLAIKTQSAGLVLETEKSNDIGNKLYPKVGFDLDKDHNFYSWEC